MEAKFKKAASKKAPVRKEKQQEAECCDLYGEYCYPCKTNDPKPKTK